MTFWGNLIGYQLVWFVAVIEAGNGRSWPGVAAALVFVAWQMLVSGCRNCDARLAMLALGVGCVVDGVLADGGWLKYSAPEPALPPHGAPVWILGLWVSFAMTLNRSLAYCRDRPALAVTLGAIGAPLAYLGAQRGWGAVVFRAPMWHGLAWLSVTWATAMLMFSVCGSRWSAAAARRRSVALGMGGI